MIKCPFDEADCGEEICYSYGCFSDAVVKHLSAFKPEELLVILHHLNPDMVFSFRKREAADERTENPG